MVGDFLKDVTSLQQIGQAFVGAILIDVGVMMVSWYRLRLSWLSIVVLLDEYEMVE